MKTSEVLVRPIISEKSLNQALLGEYIFEVKKEATKDEIKKAFKKAFDVDVVSVKTAISKGKTSRVWGRRERSQVGPMKKAQVSLKKGQKIDVFEVKGS